MSSLLFVYLLVSYFMKATMVASFKPVLPSPSYMINNHKLSTRHTLSMQQFDWKASKKATEEKMSKSIENIQSQFNTLRAGGANPAVLDRVVLDYFGTMTPLNQLARIAATGSQQLVVEPFDRSLLKDIEKAITMANLNLTPTNDGTGTLRINIPPLTEERRKELVKQAKVLSEDGKVAIRNIRRDLVDDDLQKSVDNFIKKIDTMLKTKESDLLKI